MNDGRFALSRAESLAERGKGDAAIRHDLEQQGLAADEIDGYLAGKGMGLAARWRSRYGPAAGGTGLRRGRSRGRRCARGLSSGRIRRLHLTFCLHLNVFPNRI